MENKVDYGKFLWECPPDLDIHREARPAGSIVVAPRGATPTVTFVSYGETAREMAENLKMIFVETDLVPELVVLQMLHPLDTRLIERSVARTGRLIVVEDGSASFGIGGEIVARLAEQGVAPRHVLRVGAEPVPIPSVSSLEVQVLPTVQRVLHLISKSSMNDQAS